MQDTGDASMILYALHTFVCPSHLPGLDYHVLILVANQQLALWRA